jgi:nucleoside phosphorylase
MISYNSRFVPVPFFDQKDGPLLYKFDFLFSSKENTTDVSVKIVFSEGAKISNINFVAGGEASVTDNSATLFFKSVSKDSFFGAHVFAYISPLATNIQISSSTGDVVKSDDIGFEVQSSAGLGKQLPLKYDVLVASALHEEVQPLLKGKHWDYVHEEKHAKTYRVSDVYGTVYHILCYSPNKMGMPYNGVALTKIIEQFGPRILLFIGTCAGFDKTKKIKKGAVLVPEYIYDYGSGKHQKKKFFTEYRPYDVSSSLLTFLEDMINQRSLPYDFNVELSCGFCSGASVVDSRSLKQAIEKKAGRKVLGFDMEAYVIAVINSLYHNTEALVLKGIMDFGVKKTDKDKKRAKANAAKVTDDLVTYLVNNKKI